MRRLLVPLLALAGLVASGLLAPLEIVRARAPRRWPAAPGIVLASRVEPGVAGANDAFQPVVSYSWSVGDESYERDGIWLAGDRRGSRTFAEKIVARYPEGCAVSVHYDPDDPSRGALVPDAVGRGWLLILSGAALLFAALGLWLFHPEPPGPGRPARVRRRAGTGGVRP